MVVGNHWDDVISKYKEVDLGNYKLPDNVTSVFDRVKALINVKLNEEIKYISPHVIDLAEDGYTGN